MLAIKDTETNAKTSNPQWVNIQSALTIHSLLSMLNGSDSVLLNLFK